MPTEHAYQLKIVAEDPAQPMMDEVASFLFHVDAVYELSRLIVEPRLLKQFPEYMRYYPPLPRRFYFPDEYPLSRAERLQVRSLSKHSPLEIVGTVAAIGMATGAAFWAFVQASEKISNWKLNKQKLEAEVRKAREDAAKAHAERSKAQADARIANEEARILSDDEIVKRIADGPADRALDFHVNQLEHLPFRPTEIEIQVVRIRLKRRDEDQE